MGRFKTISTKWTCKSGHKIFNTTLQELAEQKVHSILDVYKLTNDDTGYSNNLYHVDNYHLGPNIIAK